MNLKRLEFVAWCSVSFFFLLGCTKIKTTDIGTDLLPSIDNVTTFDTTLDVNPSNYSFGDSALPLLFTDLNGNTIDHVLGHVSNDPQFGQTTSSIFIEFKPPFFPWVFENVKDSLFLDSVVLCMSWSNTWGDTNAIQKINVHEVTEYIRADSAYDTDASVTYDRELGSKTFSPSILNDSLFLFRQSLNNQLRIRLRNDFGRELLAQDTGVGKPYHSDSNFRAYFKGYALVPDVAGVGGQGNALMTFNVSDTNTYLRIYYRYLRNGILDTTNKSFQFTRILSPGGHINNITRNYQGGQIENSLNGGNDPDSLIYIQTSPGTYAKVRIPALDGFKAAKGNVMVHLAELSMRQMPSAPSENDALFTVPSFLTVDYRDTVKNLQLPLFADAFVTGTYQPFVFGGIPKPVPGPSGGTLSEYKFNISRHIQGIITRNDPNFPLYVYAPFKLRYPPTIINFNLNPLARGRVKLGGTGNFPEKMKLRIIYSKI